MSKWWGDIEFALNECKTWRIGERIIAVQRKEREWRVWNIESKEENDSPLLLETPTKPDFVTTPPTQRFLVKQTQTIISVRPRLADRAMVIRPGSSITILPGEDTKLYVSSQLWLAFSLKDSQQAMFDLPLWKPSDSWFGESNMVGEVCYAKYSEANVDFANLKKRSHRLFTSINIINEHEEALTIQRIKIPMPLLDLYVDNEGQFWTDGICLVHNEDQKKPSFEIKRLKHSEMQGEYTMISNAREGANSNVFIRSIRSLIA